MKRTAMELTSTNTETSLSLYQAFQRSLVLSQTGSISLSEGKFQEALEDLNESLSLNSFNLFALTNRAQAFMALGNTPEALRDLDDVLDLNPQNAFALTLRGDVLILLNNPLHALDDLDAALTINPQNPYALICRDVALKQLKQFKQAMENIDKVLSMIPENSFALKIRSTIAQKQEAFKNSILDAKTDKGIPDSSPPVSVSNTQMRFFKGNALKPSTPSQELNENPQEPFRVK